MVDRQHERTGNREDRSATPVQDHSRRVDPPTTRRHDRSLELPRELRPGHFQRTGRTCHRAGPWARLGAERHYARRTVAIRAPLRYIERPPTWYEERRAILGSASG